MRVQVEVCAVVAAALLLTGCTATAASSARVTVTVTAAPPTPTLRAAEAAPWNLNAVCAAESEIETLDRWRDDQVQAGRLSTSQASAVLQGVAVQYQQMSQYGVPSSVEQEVTALANAAGTLEHPKINLTATTVTTAQNGLRKACQDNGLTIGVLAQGG